MFGFALLNDWSARDIQPWEYTPLGPFTGNSPSSPLLYISHSISFVPNISLIAFILAKNLGTTLSPWIVTCEALEPFRVAGPSKDPAPLPYLADNTNSNYDIHLEVRIFFSLFLLFNVK